MSGITYYGVLADGFKVTPTITAAAERTRQYAVKLIKERTPVDTGTLKRNWEVDLEGYGLRIENPTPYAPFVELGTRKMAGRHMVEGAMPAIIAEFRRQLGLLLSKKLAASITQGVTSSALDYNNATDPTVRQKAGFKRNARQRSIRVPRKVRK